MSSLNKIYWSKQGLVEALNIRVDQGKYGPNADYVMVQEISDEVLENFQLAWNDSMGNPLGHEQTLRHLYMSIISEGL